MQIIRKITIKTCGDFTVKRIKELLLAAGGRDENGNPKMPDDGTTVDLLKVAGMATSASTGQTDKGQFTRLTGTFVGTDLITGELYQSGQCILPEYIGSQLGAALLMADDTAVQFAFKIGAKAKENAITGYEFIVVPLMESRQTSAMVELMKLAGIEDKSPSKLPEAPPAPQLKEIRKEPAKGSDKDKK